MKNIWKANPSRHLNNQHVGLVKRINLIFLSFFKSYPIPSRLTPRINTTYSLNPFPANIYLDEDVLKTSFVFVSRRSFQDVFRTSSSRQIYFPWSYVFKKCLQDLLIKADIFVLVIRLQKISSRRLDLDEYICKTSLRRLQDSLPRHLQDVFKKSSRCTIKLKWSC